MVEVIRKSYHEIFGNGWHRASDIRERFRNEGCEEFTDDDFFHKLRSLEDSGIIQSQPNVTDRGEIINFEYRLAEQNSDHQHGGPEDSIIDYDFPSMF